MVLSVTFKPDNPAKVFEDLFKGFPSAAVTEGMKAASLTIKNRLKANTPVGIGGTSGNLKRSWSDIKKVSGGFSFNNPVDYGPIVEEGLYPGKGPRTTSRGFSTQAPEGIMQPLVNDTKFVESIVTFVATKVLERLNKNR